MALTLPNLLGLAGMVLFLAAYLLLQKGTWKSDDVRYSAANLLGAVLILISLIYDWNLPAFLLELAWAAISIYGIIQYFRRKGR